MSPHGCIISARKKQSGPGVKALMFCVVFFSFEREKKKREEGEREREEGGRKKAGQSMCGVGRSELRNHQVKSKLTLGTQW